LHLVDRVPLARNQRFLAIVAFHDTLKSTLLFRAGTWLAFAAAVGALAWRGRATPAGAFAISVAASGIVYILSFGVFGVAADFRYAYWCVLASLAGLAPALLARRVVRGWGSNCVPAKRGASDSRQRSISPTYGSHAETELC
jgi:hypothetical protein